MFLRRFLTFLNALGIVLVIFGLRLPWVNGVPAIGIFLYVPSYMVGMDTILGEYVFIGWLVATVSWGLFMITGEKLLLGFIMADGIATMILCLAALAYPTQFSGMQGPLFTASYGEYVSLAGGALILVGAILSSLPNLHA
jgi:hypothetical protein